MATEEWFQCVPTSSQGRLKGKCTSGIGHVKHPPRQGRFDKRRHCTNYRDNVFRCVVYIVQAHCTTTLHSDLDLASGRLDKGCHAKYFSCS